jgi:hypothetical protein
VNYQTYCFLLYYIFCSRSWEKHKIYKCNKLSRISLFVKTTLSYSLTYIPAEPRQSPGRRPGWSGNDRGMTGNNRGTSVTLSATSWMIREHPAFDSGGIKYLISPGWSGMIREGIALPASSLALPGTTGVIPGKHRSSAGTNRGWSGVWYSR